MSTASLPKPSPVTTRRRSKDFQVRAVPHDGSQVFHYNLETVLQVLVVEGHPEWQTEQLLRAGVTVRSSAKSYTAIPEHVELPPASSSPSITADDPTATYALLQSMLTKDQLRMVDELLGNVASRLRNTAQITSLNAERWKEAGSDSDDQIAIKLAAITDSLTYVASELAVLMGGGLGRARDLRAFAHPACWTDLVPAGDHETESGVES